MATNFFKISKGLTLKAQASAPSDPVDGDMYYDSSLLTVRIYQNGSWVNVSSISGTFSDALFKVQDNSDNTKEFKIDAAGTTGTSTTLTTSQTANRVITLPDATTTLAALGVAQTFSAEQTFSAQVRISDGSVTEPSIVFTSGDDGTGTGIYRVAANSLGFSSDGVNIGQYDSAGAWTIGPAANLTGYHTVNGSIRLTNSTNFGAITHSVLGEITANLYRNSSGTAKAVATATGFTEIIARRISSAASLAFEVFVDYQDSQTADATIVSTNSFSLFNIAGNGTCVFGMPGDNSAAVTHRVNAGDGGTFELFDSDTSVGTDEAQTSLRFVSNDATNTSGTALKLQALSRNSIGSSTGFNLSVAIGGNETTIMSSLDGGAITLNGISGMTGGRFFADQAAATASATSYIIGAQYSVDTDCTGGYFFRCFNSSASTIGRIEASSNTTTTFTGSSDARLKQNPSDFEGLEILMQIQPREFEWISNPGRRDRGFYAQELYEIYPQAVSVGNDELTPDGSLANPWGIDYGRLTPVLVKALQELKQQFDEYIALHP